MDNPTKNPTSNIVDLSPPGTPQKEEIDTTLLDMTPPFITPAEMGKSKTLRKFKDPSEYEKEEVVEQNIKLRKLSRDLRKALENTKNDLESKMESLHELFEENLLLQEKLDEKDEKFEREFKNIWSDTGNQLFSTTCSKLVSMKEFEKKQEEAEPALDPNWFPRGNLINHRYFFDLEKKEEEERKLSERRKVKGEGEAEE